MGGGGEGFVCGRVIVIWKNMGEGLPSGDGYFMIGVSIVV